jgi:hypothetical protein
MRLAGTVASDSTHCRTGTWGMTWSIRCAAVCDMRRAPHDGQKPRRLQLNASSLSWPHSSHRSLTKPWARMPHSRKASNSSLTNCGKAAPVPASVWAMKLAACCWTGARPGQRRAGRFPCLPQQGSARAAAVQRHLDPPPGAGRSAPGARYKTRPQNPDPNPPKPHQEIGIRRLQRHLSPRRRTSLGRRNGPDSMLASRSLSLDAAKSKRALCTVDLCEASSAPPASACR